MRNTHLFLLFLASVFFLVQPRTFADYSGGSGTAGDPYRIGSIADYNALVYNTGHWDKHFLLATSLNFGNNTINPLKDQYDYTAFTGVFDGNGNSLRNFKISGPSAALFNSIGEGGVVRNLALQNVDITATTYYGGGIASWLEGGAIINCSVSGKVSAMQCGGGLVAQATDGLISDCTSTAQVTGSGEITLGGIVGLCSNSTIIRSSATGNITNSGGERGGTGGGLVGSCQYSIVTDCYATGTVRSQIAGGLIGETEYSGKPSEISRCYAAGLVTIPVSLDWFWLGGLLGLTDQAVVTASYWDVDRSQMTESAGGEGRSTTDMTYPHATDCYVGWDFHTVWKDDQGNTNNGYPVLRARDSVGLAQLFVTKTADGSLFDTIGTDINYTIQISNVGNVPVTNVEVEDALCAFFANFTVIQPGEEKTCSASYTVTSEDFDAGSVLNRVEVTGTDPNGNPVSAYDTAYVEANYIEQIKLTITSEPANFQKAGETITFTITVENTGNLPLSDITVATPLTNLSEVISKLAPGESESVETSHVVTDWNMRAGHIKSTVTASCENRQGSILLFSNEFSINTAYQEGGYSGGNGSFSTPFLISSLDDWDHFSSSPEDWHKHFKLTADLDFAGKEFVPVGWFNGQPDFSGSFDGNNYCIRNITSDDDVSGNALFYALQGAIIRNLHLEAIDVNGGYYCAALACLAENSTLINCSAQGIFDNAWFAGGLVSQADNCHFIGCSSFSEIGHDDYGCYVAGGLVAYAEDSHFLNCYARGKLWGQEFEGGLVAYLVSTKTTSTITNCYAAVEIEPWYDYPSGLVGEIQGGATISASYWDKSLSSEYSAGGEGRTTSEMTHPHAGNCYVGWDFNKVWLKDSAALNDGYPRLRPSQDNDQGQLLITIEPDCQNFYGEDHRVQYLVTVANVGAVPLNYLSAYDSLTGSYVSINTLQSGERTCFEISYSATQDDVNTGMIENVITASGYNPNWVNLSVEGRSNLDYLEPHDDLQIEPVTLTEDFVEVGEKISFTVWIENAGNAPLRDIVIRNEKTGFSETFPLLDAEDYTHVTMEYMVTQEDWNAGEVAQTFQVTARSVLGEELTASHTLVIPKAFTSEYTAGSGTESDPYIITTVQDWLDLTQVWRHWNRYFIIAADLDFEGVAVQPVGETAKSHRFAGSIDGAGHRLKNITLSGDKVALFLEIYGGNIRDLHLDNIKVDASTDGAALAVKVTSDSTITGCSSSGVIEAADRAGGLVAESSYSTFTECWSTASVKGKWAGGLVDSFYSDHFTDCYALGTVTGENHAGGLLGEDDAYFTVSTISRCYAAGKVTLTDPSGTAGGLVADGNSSAFDTSASYWDTEATGQNNGVVGTGCTTAQMTYPYMGVCYEGWDFDEVWADDTDGSNGGYPFLLRDPRTEKNRLHLSKTTAITTFSHLEEEIPYTVLVFNTGATVLTDVEVRDPLTAFSELIQELEPGQGAQFETSHRITQTDMDTHYLINTATVTGTGADGEEVTVSDSVLIRKEITAGYSGGTGTEANPYLIAKPGDWLDLADTMDDWDKYFRLTADLDFLNVPFSPIEDPSGWKNFEGHLDGAGHSMKNIVVKGTNAWLFRKLENATVKDLHLESMTLHTTGSAAGLAIYADDCSISGCSFSGTITADGYAAGLVNFPTRTHFTNCLVSAAITGGAETAGMVCTADDCTVTACATSGTIINNGTYLTGGLAAEIKNNSMLSECRSTVDLNASWTGGLVGLITKSSMEDCYARGKVIGVTKAGGLVGESDRSTIKNSYATGEVQVPSETVWAGGLLGSPDLNSTVEKSYWDQQSSGMETDFGGEGRSTQDMTYPHASDCYVGWDFETLWAADDAGINDGYPRLRNDAENEYRGLNITVTAPSDTFSKPDDKIPFTISVQNISSKPVNNITVQDPALNINETIAVLASGATHTFTHVQTVTQADLDRAYVESIATASAVLSGGRQISIEAGAKVMAHVQNRLQVTTMTTQTSFSAVNDAISYFIQVKNTGNQTLRNIELHDTLTGFNNHIDVLAPDASVQSNTTYTATQADLDAGKISNTATATGIDPAGNLVTGGDTAADVKADDSAYTVEVTITADKARFREAGESIKFTIAVVNSGTATLSNIKVTNPLTGLDETIATLKPGIERTYNEQYTVTGMDVELERVENTATVTFKAPNENNIKVSNTLVVVKPKIDTPHPADPEGTGMITEEQAGDFIQQWQEGNADMQYAIRAQFIVESGGHYIYDPGKEEPLCWIPLTDD